MGISEVITIITFFLGSILGFVFSYIGVRINESRAKKRHFRSLYDEIKYNLASIENFQVDFTDFGFDAQFDEFRNFTYHAILISGEIYELNKDLANKIDTIYELIDDFNKNKRAVWDGDIQEFLDHLIDTIQPVINEMPNVLPYLNSS